MGRERGIDGEMFRDGWVTAGQVGRERGIDEEMFRDVPGRVTVYGSGEEFFGTAKVELTGLLSNAP